MAEKGKFEFVRDINEKDELKQFDDDIKIKKVETEEEKQVRFRKQKRAKFIRIAKRVLGMSVLTIVLFVFVMLWQDDWSLMAIGDGLWLVVVLEFFLGWVLFVYNKNIFSPLIFGFKTFGLMFVGKRTKTDYYGYMKNIQENQIPAYFYIMLFMAAFIVFIPALIILLILI